jgi:Receptor family ligand binding region
VSKFRAFCQFSSSNFTVSSSIPPTGINREYDGFSAAINMATIDANAITPQFPNSRFPGYKLLVKISETACKPDMVLRHFINYYSHRKHLIGVLGPCKFFFVAAFTALNNEILSFTSKACTEAIEAMAAISKHFKMNVITSSAEGVSLSDREEYPYFFRTIGETTQ